MSTKLIEHRYNQGRDAYDRGTSLKSIIQTIDAIEAQSSADDSDIMSLTAGFFDGVLADLRAIKARI